MLLGRKEISLRSYAGTAPSANAMGGARSYPIFGLPITREEWRICEAKFYLLRAGGCVLIRAGKNRFRKRKCAGQLLLIGASCADADAVPKAHAVLEAERFDVDKNIEPGLRFISRKFKRVSRKV